MSNVLNDTQIEQLSEALTDQTSEANKKIQELPSNNGITERVPEDPNAYEEEVVNKYIDPMTGVEKDVPTSIDPLQNVNLSTDSFDKLMNMTDEDIHHMDISLEEFKQSSILGDNDGLSKKDMEAFKKVFDRYRKGEDFAIYNSLPHSVKKYVDAICQELINQAGNDNFSTNMNEMRNVIIKSLFDQSLNDIYLNKSYTDLNTSINDTYNDLIGSVVSEENMSVRHKISEFPKLAEKIKDENPEKSEMIYKFYNSFIEAQTYKKLVDAIKTGKLRVKNIEIEKFDREAKAFNRQYTNSSKIVDDISNLPFIVARNIGCTIEDAKRLILTYTKYVRFAKLNINKLEDYCFIYYFSKNIIGMDNYSKTSFEEKTFYDSLKKNLQNVLDAIYSIEDNIINKK